jgi:hypothetical protein
VFHADPFSPRPGESHFREDWKRGIQRVQPFARSSFMVIRNRHALPAWQSMMKKHKELTLVQLEGRVFLCIG